MPTPQEMRYALKMRQMRSELKRRQQEQIANAPKPEFKDEMPEWLGDSRTVVKNLTDTPEQSIDYLQRKHPDAEFTKQGDQIYARKKGERDWGTLDPSMSFKNLGDTWNDTKDLAYDAVQAGTEALGAGAGVATAALTANPIIGGAAYRGVTGLASGGASAAREKLAEMLGVRDADYMNAAKDGAIGAVIPDALKYAGKGVRLAGRQVPKVYSAALGVAPDVLQTIAKKGEDIAKLSADGVTGLYDNAARKVNQSLLNQREKAAALFEGLKGTDAKVDMSGAKIPFRTAIANEEASVASGLDSELAKDRLKALLEAKGYVFNSKEASQSALLGADGKNIINAATEVPDQMTIKQALDLQQMLNDEFADHGKGFIAQAKRAGMGNGQDALVSRTGMQSSAAINDSLEAATGGASAEAKQAYQSYIRNARELAPAFKDAKAVEASFAKYGKGGSRVFNESMDHLDEATRKSLKDDMSTIGAFNYLNPIEKKGWQGTADSIGGVTPLEKILGLAGAGIGYVSGGGYAGSAGLGYLGKKTGKLLTGPGAIKKFVSAQNAAEDMTSKVMQRLDENPALLNAIYGGTQAAVSE